MLDEDLPTRLLKTEAAHLAALACNRLLVATAGLFACVALLLSGALGFVLGQLSSRRKDTSKQDAKTHLSDQGPKPQTVVYTSLGLPAALKQPPSSPVQDQIAGQQCATPSNKDDQQEALHRINFEQKHDPPNLNNVPEALKAVYETYISRWQDNATPWKEPTGRESRIGSRLPSYASEASEQLIWQSSLRPGFHELSIGNSSAGFGTQLLYADWELTQGQIQFCFDTKGALISLDNKQDESQVRLYKAILDGKQAVAVRTLKLNKESFPEPKLTEFAVQQQSLNSVPQLVHFYGLSRTEDAVMLVYELVEGAPLREAISRNPVAMGWYCSGKAIARDIAQGLAYLHKMGMEHRSFKTGCVLVRSADGSARIANAGLQTATRYCQKSRSKRLVESFEWAAPELLLGQRCGCEADIFGLGVTLWELVTQEMPIRGALRNVQVPEECPRSIANLISKCMAREPANRPTADQVVATIQRAWNASPDKAHKLNEAALGRPMLSTRRSLQGSKSHPVNMPFPQPRDAISRLASPRGTRDSVSEMVDLRRRVPVRRGTLNSLQSAGGAVGMSPSAFGQEERIGLGLGKKPPPSPHSSPEMYRRGLSPVTRRAGSLDTLPEEGSTARMLLAQNLAAMGTASNPNSRQSSPFQWYMSHATGAAAEGTGLDRQQARLLQERKMRGRALQCAHSAPGPDGSQPVYKQAKALEALPMPTTPVSPQRGATYAAPTNRRTSATPRLDLGASLASELSLTDVVEREAAGNLMAGERPSGPAIPISTPAVVEVLSQPGAGDKACINSHGEASKGPPADVANQRPQAGGDVKAHLASAGDHSSDLSVKDSSNVESSADRIEPLDLGGSSGPKLREKEGSLEFSRPSQAGSSSTADKLAGRAAIEREGSLEVDKAADIDEPGHESMQDRWRLMRNMTFGHWLARNTADEPATPASVGRTSSFPRFSTFRRRRSAKEITEAGPALVEISEPTASL